MPRSWSRIKCARTVDFSFPPELKKDRPQVASRPAALEGERSCRVKAISALGAYAQLCQMLGKKDEAASYRKVAEQYVQDWRRMAADGDHYRLAFDQPGTWSQKYNLIWDKLLGLNLFPSDVARTEIKFY